MNNEWRMNTNYDYVTIIHIYVSSSIFIVVCYMKLRFYMVTLKKGGNVEMFLT